MSFYFDLVVLSHFVHDVFLFCEDLAFFDLLAPLSSFWHVIVLIIVTALAASSVDTLQTAIASVISSDIIRFGVSDKTARWLTRGLLILVNIPAVILSSFRFNVIGLFLVADLVCATAVLPVFLGMITEDRRFISAPTEDKMTLTSTRFVDYDSQSDLATVETNLLEEINTQIAQDVINKLLSNW